MDELLELLRDHPALLAEISNSKIYVGEIIGEPHLVKFIGPMYSVHIRSLTRNPLLSIFQGAAAEIILTTGERLPVTVVGSSHINPTPQAWESGFWTVWDQVRGIKDTDLSPEQVPLARWFMQRQPEQAGGRGVASLQSDEVRWRQEVRIKFKVLQEAARLGMSAARFDEIARQRNGYLQELKKLFGGILPDDLKPYEQDPPRPDDSHA